MPLTAFISIVMASLVFQQANALPGPAKRSLIKIAPHVQSGHPEAYDAFLRAPSIVLGDVAQRRQSVPGDGKPDPNRPSITPDNIYVLQCRDAGFLGDLDYSSFNTSQAFADKFDNQTSSLSTNTGGQCQFYKFTGCDEKGDDRGVALSYKFNLGMADSDGYAGDYDNQISSWRC
ncbi:hypothetical protein LZ32DRAFT_659203 [Colletotrichum eremochloae]|nr:hypothetical protein LZ32DRAFT_659203 [Colletotrichum eremochloae]